MITLADLTQLLQRHARTLCVSEQPLARSPESDLAPPARAQLAAFFAAYLLSWHLPWKGSCEHSANQIKTRARLSSLQWLRATSAEMLMRTLPRRCSLAHCSSSPHVSEGSGSKEAPRDCSLSASSVVEVQEDHMQPCLAWVSPWWS